MSPETMWANDAASRALGMELVSMGEGRAVVAMTVRDDMVNGHGLCHGGLVASLADSAFALACNSRGISTVAAGFDITFLRPSRLGDELEATAESGRWQDGPGSTTSPSGPAGSWSRSSAAGAGLFHRLDNVEIMQQRRLGDLTVSAIGLGGMPMSVRRTNDEERGLATIRTAVENGVTLIDTADAYSQGEADFGHNEVLIAKALKEIGADQVLVATKGGHTRYGDAWNLDGSPSYLRSAAQASAQRLGVEQIGLYQHHRPDPKVAYEDSIGALKDLLDDGLIARAGISNANPEQIRQAHAILGDGLVSVQNQYSPHFRSSEPEIDVCDELGLAFLPWSPLGGMGAAAGLENDYAQFAEVATKHGVSPQQVALAWELARSDNVIPIPGASRPESVLDSTAAVHLVLDPEDLAALSA